MRFEEAYLGWNESRLTQEQAALVLGVSDRTFRLYIHRYEEGGLEGLNDRRLGHASLRRVPVDEVMEMVNRYRSRYRGWPVKHYYSWYCKEGASGSIRG
jgi:transposase